MKELIKQTAPQFQAELEKRGLLMDAHAELS
jgi:hypothetical protein